MVLEKNRFSLGSILDLLLFQVFQFLHKSRKIAGKERGTIISDLFNSKRLHDESPNKKVLQISFNESWPDEKRSKKSQRNYHN